jgi:hypothetical protein
MKIQKLLVATALSGLFSSVLFAAGENLDTAKIDTLTGLKGKLNEKEGVYRVSFPRDGVKVAVDGWTMPPFMGLGTWAAFTKGGTPKQWSWATPFFSRTRSTRPCLLLLKMG